MSQDGRAVKCPGTGWVADRELGSPTSQNCNGEHPTATFTPKDDEFAGNRVVNLA